MAVLPFALHHQNPRSNTRANKMCMTDQAAHQWYRFVLSYPPHLVREYLERFECRLGSAIFDPFAGTGTTLVEAQKLGMRAIGMEALPMAHFASSVKLDWNIDSSGLLFYAEKVADSATKKLNRQGLSDIGFDVASPGLNLRSFPPETQKILLTNSVSPLPMHKLLVLLETLNGSPDSRYKSHLRLALAKAAVDSISNLHFGPEVGVRDIKADVPVVQSWLNEVRVIANDLSSLSMLATGYKGSAIKGDSRLELKNALTLRSVDAVVTSPPYPNEKDYTRTTRLESVLLGFVQDRQQLQALKRQLVRSNTRSVYRSDDDDLWIRNFSQVHSIADEIERRRIELGKTSGFERQYARVTKLYFGGMARHLAELKPFLKPGARLAYVVGDQASYLRVMIRTGNILAEIADSLGYRVEGIDLFRTRISTATKAQLREEVVVLRAPGA